MAKHFRPYDFNLTGNGSQVIYATGKVAKILSATGSVSIRVDGGSAVPLAVGQGIWLDDGDSFLEITVQDTSGAPNVGKVFIGAGQLIDQTFSGSISNFPTSVPDRIAAAALAGKSFRRVVACNTNAAGQSALACIYNPIGSGKVVDLVDLVSSGTQSNNHFVSRFDFTAAPAALTFPKNTGDGNNSSVVSVANNLFGAGQATFAAAYGLIGFTATERNLIDFCSSNERNNGQLLSLIQPFEVSLQPGQGVGIYTLSSVGVAVHAIRALWIER
jgi:hypothetical protein